MLTKNMLIEPVSVSPDVLHLGLHAEDLCNARSRPARTPVEIPIYGLVPEEVSRPLRPSDLRWIHVSEPRLGLPGGNRRPLARRGWCIFLVDAREYSGPQRRLVFQATAIHELSQIVNCKSPTSPRIPLANSHRDSGPAVTIAQNATSGFLRSVMGFNSGGRLASRI
jgi:hypothetical protein